MTTITYKDNIIAYDSRRTAGGLIKSDETDKRYTISDTSYLFATGFCPDIENLVSYLKGEEEICPNNVAAGFLTEGEKVYDLGVNSEGVWKYFIDYPSADGSGGDHALTAMDFGASAVEAVEAAKKRDANTGGRVRWYNVVTGEEG